MSSNHFVSEVAVMTEDDGQEFELFQSIPTKKATGWESFAIAGTRYLAVMPPHATHS